MADQPAPIRYPFPAPPTLYHPSPVYRELRESQPVAEVMFPDGRKGWVVTRYPEVRQVLVDPRFSRAAAADGPQLGLGRVLAESILGMDPPEHTRLRKLVARAFTARRIEELRPRVAKLVDELLDKLATMPQPADLVGNFSLPLPVQVICELLGVPADDRDRFKVWSDTMLGDYRRDLSEMDAAYDEFSAYLSELIAAKRAEPADDLMSALIAARDEQDKLSERELVLMGVTILIAGHETTANSINLCLLTLFQYPDELARLRAAPETVPQAVEELVRFVQLGEGGGMPRVTTEPVELGGVMIPAGAFVLPLMGAGNRDPIPFPDPDQLHLSRANNQHLGFGAGIHHCLGAQLARMELQEALGGLIRRMPNLRVAVPDSELRFKQGQLIRSLESLPVIW